MRKYITTFVLILMFLNSRSQNNEKFCKAVAGEKFKKAERIFVKQIKKRKHGTQYDNGPGSGIQTTHHHNFDTLTMWLKSQSCVEEAFWDKCQMKIAIYPGWSIIGAKFKTNNGIREKCFYIQEGTPGRISICCWRPKIFNMTNKLVYKKMYDCEGFVLEQKRNCTESKR